MKKYAVEEDPTTENVEDIDEESTDEIMKTILDMKDGQAMTVVIGDDDTTKQIYLVYREPIENQVEAYTDPEQHKNDVLSAMKHEEFDEMLKKLAEEMNINLSSACDSYKPSRFEETKKK